MFPVMPLDKKSFYARTMHTPDSPERAALRSALRDVSKALLPLHRALIDAAKDDYAFGIAPVKPSQLLQLLNDDPFFAWLKPVTALIVDIDEMARSTSSPPKSRPSPTASIGCSGPRPRRPSPRSTSRCCSAASTLPSATPPCAKRSRVCAPERSALPEVRSSC